MKTKMHMWYEWAGVLACWYFQICPIESEGKYSSGIQFLHCYSLRDVTCSPVWGREIDCVCLCSNLTGREAAVDSSVGGVSFISFSQLCLPVSRGRFDSRFVIADRNRWALYCQGPCLYGNVNWVSPADRTVDPTVPAASSGWQQPCSRGWEAQGRRSLTVGWMFCQVKFRKCKSSRIKKHSYLFEWPES